MKNVVEKIIKFLGTDYEILINENWQMILNNVRNKSLAIERKEQIIKSIKNSIKIDIAKGVGIYISDSDNLISVNVKGSKGRFVISTEFERNGEKFNLETSVISAGGYNVQNYHYRMVTKTNLPKVNTLISDYYKKLEKLESNIKKLNSSLRDTKNYIENYKLEISNFENRFKDIPKNDIPLMELNIYKNRKKDLKKLLDKLDKQEKELNDLEKELNQ